MKITRFDKPGDFYNRAQAFLLAREAEHNLILGICGHLMQQPGEIDPRLYMAVVEEGHTTIAAALMAPTRNLVLSSIEEPGAISLISRHLHDEQKAPPGVVGPEGTALAFAEEWHGLTGQSYTLQMAMRIYKLEEVNPPVGVPGHMRQATPGDRDLLVAWVTAFEREALGEIDNSGVGDMIDSWFASGSRVPYFWEDDGPVSTAAYTGPTPHGMRIGPVYTPPNYRRRGYAGALVAALSQLLLDSGRTFCTLFTDLSNPTSNRIYQDVGYTPVSDAAEYKIGVE